MSGDDPALYLWQGKLGIITGDDNITIEDYLDTTTISAAVDGSDDGLVGLSARNRPKTIEVGCNVLLLII